MIKLFSLIFSTFSPSKFSLTLTMMPSNHLLKTNYVFPHEWLVCTLLQLSTELLEPFKKLKIGLIINSIAPCQMEDVFCYQLCLVNRYLEKDDDSGRPRFRQLA